MNALDKVISDMRSFEKHGLKYTHQRRAAHKKRKSRGGTSISGMAKHLNSMHIIPNAKVEGSGLSVKSDYSLLLNKLLTRSNNRRLTNGIGTAILSNESPSMHMNFEIRNTVPKLNQMVLKKTILDSMNYNDSQKFLKRNVLLKKLLEQLNHRIDKNDEIELKHVNAVIQYLFKKMSHQGARKTSINDVGRGVVENNKNKVNINLDHKNRLKMIEKRMIPLGQRGGTKIPGGLFKNDKNVIIRGRPLEYSKTHKHYDSKRSEYIARMLSYIDAQMHNSQRTPVTRRLTKKTVNISKYKLESRIGSVANSAIISIITGMYGCFPRSVINYPGATYEKTLNFPPIHDVYTDIVDFSSNRLPLTMIYADRLKLWLDVDEFSKFIEENLSSNGKLSGIKLREGIIEFKDAFEKLIEDEEKNESGDGDEVKNIKNYFSNVNNNRQYILRVIKFSINMKLFEYFKSSDKSSFSRKYFTIASDKSDLVRNVANCTIDIVGLCYKIIKMHNINKNPFFWKHETRTESQIATVLLYRVITMPQFWKEKNTNTTVIPSGIIKGNSKAIYPFEYTWDAIYKNSDRQNTMSFKGSAYIMSLAYIFYRLKQHTKLTIIPGMVESTNPNENISFKVTFSNPSSEKKSLFENIYEPLNIVSSLTDFDVKRYKRNINISQEYSRPTRSVIRMSIHRIKQRTKKDKTTPPKYTISAYAAVPPSIKTCGNRDKPEYVTSLVEKYKAYPGVVKRYISKEKFEIKTLKGLQKIIDTENISGSSDVLSSSEDSYRYCREYYVAWRNAMLKRFDNNVNNSG